MVALEWRNQFGVTPVDAAESGESHTPACQVTMDKAWLVPRVRLPFALACEVERFGDIADKIKCHGQRKLGNRWRHAARSINKRDVAVCQLLKIYPIIEAIVKRPRQDLHPLGRLPVLRGGCRTVPGAYHNAIGNWNALEKSRECFLVLLIRLADDFDFAMGLKDRTAFVGVLPLSMGIRLEHKKVHGLTSKYFANISFEENEQLSRRSHQEILIWLCLLVQQKVLFGYALVHRVNSQEQVYSLLPTKTRCAG